MNKPTTIASLCRLIAPVAALALPACTLPTKLAELTGGGDTTESTDTSGAMPATTTATGPGDGSTGGDTGAAGACTQVTLKRKPLRPNVVLVLDKSGSMVAEPFGFWDHDDDPNTPTVTRWSSLHAVVDAVLTEFEAAINFGAHLFPGIDATANYNADACVIDPDIDILVAPTNRDAILAGIPAADELLFRGGTPTAAAVATALDHLKSLDPNVPRAVLLVTDGAANCMEGAEPPELFEVYDESLHGLVGDAFAVDHIPTYVVGVGIEDITTPVVQDGTPDDTNAFARLNDLATLGGRPKLDPDEKFYNTRNQIELAAALDAITFDALTCIIPLDPPLIEAEGTVVEIDGVTVPHVDDCEAETGWTFSQPEGPFEAIVLCGSACPELKLAGEAAITVCMEG